MTKFTIAILFASLFFACGNSSEETTETKDSSGVIKEETEIIEEENEESQAKFSMIEDYAEIKSKDELYKTFNKENLKDDVNWYAEGTVSMDVTVLTNPENNHIITYVWNEDLKTNSVEASYFIYDDDFNTTGTQTIESKEGLALGMSLAELREWNGADFKFYGFGWDYGGTIMTNDESKIADSKITMLLQDTGDNTPSFAMGDVELNADDERLKDAKIIVSFMEMYIK